MVQGCKRCIIHYDQNVMEKEVARLTEESFSTIRRSADVRQTQENIAQRLDDICKTLPPHFNSEIHGSHKWCYHQFTNISGMLKRRHATVEQAQESTAASRSSIRCFQKEKSGLLFPHKECLFVEKPQEAGSSIEGLAKLLTERAVEAIKERAREKCDFVMLG